MTNLRHLESLLAAQQGAPPIDKWHPPLSGDIDIRIGSDGRWFHEGEAFQRLDLVKLFAGILRREEDGEYYLVTPVEKWRIQVDDLPLQLIDMEVADAGASQRIIFKTNTGNWFSLDAGHPLTVSSNASGEPEPALTLEHGLEGRISRAVFYRLVELGVEEGGELFAYSNGERFLLGSTE